MANNRTNILDIDDLYELFYVSSYGLNQRCKDAIKEVFRAYHVDTPALFFEYFLSQPIPKTPPEEWGKDWEKGVRLVAPFASRMIEHASLVPRLQGDDVSASVRRDTAFEELALSFSWEQSQLAKDSFVKWAHPENTASDLLRGERQRFKITWSQIPERSTGEGFAVGLVEDWTVKRQEDYGDDKSSKLLYELYKSVLVGHKMKNETEEAYQARQAESPSCVLVPIASSRLFYGIVWLMLPGAGACLGPGLVEFRKTIGARVAGLINRVYLPALAILHEHWLENLLYSFVVPGEELTTYMQRGYPLEYTRDHANTRQPVDGQEAALYRNPFVYLPDHDDTSSSRSLRVVDDVETQFKNLWEKCYVVHDDLKDGDKVKKLKDRLKEICIFRRFLVASENMTTLVHSVISAAKTLMQDDDDTLPACLVVGGAGSGKEKLSRMLRLFNDDYRRGKEYVINLAAVRPAPLTAALMTGVESHCRIGPVSVKCGFQGLLERISPPAPTIRLDEFNSMDPDSQGVLLRFLDNSQIVPLGALKDKRAPRCLIVGCMNEDPEDISRERAIDFFRQNHYLGSLIGDILYEHFMHIRRLRPDVMYRMMRNGKFSIPGLKDRTDDIPLLFQLFTTLEIRALKGREAKLHLPLEALNRLSMPDLLWPGNVRQLQALAKLVTGNLARRKPEGRHYILEIGILEEALQEVGLTNRTL